jgi:hypothetical protein
VTTTPNCPLCDQPPAIVLPGNEQAFCGNAACPVYAWNPSVSLEENLLSAGPIEVSPPEQRGAAE